MQIFGDTLTSSIHNFNKRTENLLMGSCSKLEFLPPADVYLESLKDPNLRKCLRLKSVRPISKTIPGIFF